MEMPTIEEQQEISYQDYLQASRKLPSERRSGGIESQFCILSAIVPSRVLPLAVTLQQEEGKG
jgi:hypothetical protein